MTYAPPLLDSDNGSHLHRIVIVGGGAGGLHLATRLAGTLGQRRIAEIFLVDRYPTQDRKSVV